LVALMRGAAVWAHEPPPMQALDFVPPVPGSYQLHAIMPAPAAKYSTPLAKRERSPISRAEKSLCSA
jgi:hypothetical protein